VRVALYAEEGARTPEYADNGCSGADVFAHLKEPLVLQPGERALIPTGLKVEFPAGFELQVRPRSGLALKRGITVLNTPGTIDSSYRGEIGIILINHGTSSFTVDQGMKIAQLVMAPVERMTFLKVDQESMLSLTERGAGGFGHTGS